MAPLFITVGKRAYGLVTNWYGLISQKPWIFISSAVKYQQILHWYLVTLLPPEGGGIASSEYATGWIMGNCRFSEEEGGSDPTGCGAIQPPIQLVPELFHVVKVAGAWSWSHTPSSDEVKNEQYC
jgi:hypothetical protein